MQKKLLEICADNFLCSSQFANLSAAELDKVNLHDELQLDSLDAVELAMRIEKEFTSWEGYYLFSKSSGKATYFVLARLLLSKSFGEVTDFILARLKN